LWQGKFRNYQIIFFFETSNPKKLVEICRSFANVACLEDQHGEDVFGPAK
jgi:hypothetical protein